jgi:cell wall-associated NlpC family hydrolase
MRLVEPLNAAERAALVAHARSLVGVPFKHRGRSRDGIDCVGLVQVCLQAVGRETQDDLTYPRIPVPGLPALRDALIRHFGEPVKTLAPGDVVAMRWTGDLSHVAIVGDYPYGGLSVIHALALDRRVVETRLADPWPRRIAGIWRP